MKPTPPSDAELLRLMMAGDERAFAALYERTQRQIYRFALLMSGMPNIAEEVTQDLFLMLIREPDRYDPARGPLLTFLYGVARNYVLRALKRERHFVALADESEDEVLPAHLVATRDPLEDCTRNELIRLVRQAVLTLPPRYREVVVLCDFQEISCADAALALNCAIGTVNSRLHRGHALLLKKLRAMDKTGSAADENTPSMRCFA